MSQQTVYVVSRGEDNEGASIEAVCGTHARAVEHVLAMIPRLHALHPDGWQVISRCVFGDGGFLLPCRWECGIDNITIEEWPVTP
jgi:hypothetical protein